MLKLMTYEEYQRDYFSDYTDDKGRALKWPHITCYHMRSGQEWVAIGVSPRWHMELGATGRSPEGAERNLRVEVFGMKS